MSLKFIEVKIPESIMQKYLEEKFKQDVKILKYERLGTGWHATGYKIDCMVKKKEHNIIIRTLRPEGFSHDYASDRAGTFLLAHELSKNVAKHTPSLDVGGYTKDGKLIFMGDCKEFFQIVELVEGKEYGKELMEIMERGSLTEEDRRKALLLSDYLVSIHKEKFEIKNEEDEAAAKSIYKRHLRDCICHGEMLMGVIDTYPEKLTFTNKKEFIKMVSECVSLREDLKDDYKRLCRIHGDIHPMNIIFDKEDFKVLDASRELFGDPADDALCLAMNYVWYALQHKGRHEGPFKELFEIFWNNYMEKTRDNNINKVAPIFIAFRYVVMAHPVFFDFQTDDVREKLFRIIFGALKDKEFNPEKINDYID